MKQKLLLFAFTLISAMLLSQAQNMAFEDFKTNDGTQNFFYKNIVKTDASGNIYTLGATTTSNSSTDILLTKKNSSGVTLWSKQINGTANYHDFGSGLAITSSGDVYITGAITNNTTTLAPELIIRKYNSSGTQQFSSTYSGVGYGCVGKDIVVDGSGNSYITGAEYNSGFNADILTIAFGSTGTQIWTDLFDNNSLNDGGVKIGFRSNKVTVTGAVTQSTNNYKIATLTFTASTGVRSETITLGSTMTSSVEIVTGMTTDASGNTYICGATEVSGQGFNMYVAKLTSSLTIAWQQTYNGVSNLDDQAKGIQVDGSGNVYITGYSTSSTLGKEIRTIKYNSSGTLQWNNVINSTGNNPDQAFDMEMDASSNIYVCGSISSDINQLDYYTVKYNSGGTKIWDIQTDGNHLNDQATNLAIDSLNNIIVTGESETAPSTYVYTTCKYVQKDIITPTDFNNELPASKFKYFANKGQIINTNGGSVSDIKFYTNNTNPLFYLQDNSYSFVFSKIDADTTTADTLHRIDLNFTNSYESSRIYPIEQKRDGYLNYFLAHTGDKGISGVFGNQKLITTNLYNNIDLMYSSNIHGIKYYFIIKPGGDMRDIKLQFTGASSFSLNGTNNTLSINSSIGSLTFDKPTVYQLSPTNTTVAVTGWTPDWQTDGANNKYKFNTGSYTTSLTLVIEVDQGNSSASSNDILGVNWSTYVGGANIEKQKDIKSDVNNNLFIVGETTSTNFPQALGITSFNIYQAVNKGSSDAYVVKFNPNGAHLWSSYVGGTRSDVFNSLDFASSGDIYFVGNTTSPDLIKKTKSGALDGGNFVGPFNTTYGWQRDGFIFQLDQAGLTNPWLTYYTGNNDDSFNKCKFDASGNLFVVGATSSPNASVVATGSQYNHTWTNPSTATNDFVTDGYIVRFDASSARTWATCIGSSNGTGSSFSNDVLYDLDFDASGDVYTVGNSSGINYPNVTLGSSDNFAINGVNKNGVITRFSNTGNIKWSSYLGGAASSVASVKVKNSNIYLVGNSGSITPLLQVENSGSYYYNASNSGDDDAFFAVYNSSNQKTHCSFIGGSGEDVATDLEINNNNSIFISGYTYSSNFPTPTGGNPVNTYNGSFAGGTDYFICSLSAGRSDLVWSTNLGGSGNEGSTYGDAEITFDGNNFLHIAGSSNSSNFPPDDNGGAPTYFVSTKNGINDATVTRFDMTPVVLAGVKENTLSNNGSLSIYPNPANSSISIKLDEYNKDMQYTVTNAMGQLVLQGKITNLLTNININSLSTGVYIINIVNEKGISSAKFIKYD